MPTTFFLEGIAIISAGLYLLRWVFQLKASRKQKRSVTPIMYWIITIMAGGLSAIYTFLLGSIVFPLTFGFTILIAMYNIYLELKNKKVD